MTSQERRKQQLQELIEEFQAYRRDGRHEFISEQTIREWLGRFLAIFDWDVRDTSQIQQGSRLPEAARRVLSDIDSTHTVPDYSFLVGRNKVTFLDAKDVTVNIGEDSGAAFQIKSYGYSINAPCAFISNFEEFAIYDTTYKPSRDQPANLGRKYFTIDDYLENFETLDNYILKANIFDGRLHQLTSDSAADITGVNRIPVDIDFANQLSQFRLILANNIYLLNREFFEGNVERLGFFTQVIINRILFIRVCEARCIEEYGKLKTFQEDGFWDRFKESSYFEFFRRYDGPLFTQDEIRDLEINDEIFNDLLLYLYYPSPYKFDVIPTKHLSDVYELFLSKRLVIENGQIKEQLKDEYIKTNGAVSTPQYIVQKIVENTIESEPLLDEGIESIFTKKIIDIACGSGVFLITAYEHLEEIFTTLFRESRDPRFREFFIDTSNGPLINLNGKRALIQQCIFGVDIDSEATEVAKMSLSLKIVDSVEYIEKYQALGLLGQRILQNVGENIKCGNSLVSTDILDEFPEIIENQVEITRTKPFDFNSDDGFKEIFDEHGGFDFVIGNPPYVEVKNYNVDLNFMHQYLKTKFPNSTKGKIDLAIPFIERGLQILNETGRLGFIVQKRFFKTEYGKKIRSFIGENNYIYSILDFTSNSIFKNRITYVAIITLDKNSSQQIYYSKNDNEGHLIEAEIRQIPAPRVSSERYSVIQATDLNYFPIWCFEYPDLIPIVRDLVDQFGTLDDFTKIAVGLQVLWVKAYHIRPTRVTRNMIVGNSNIEENIQIEKAACVPIICNEKFTPFRRDNPNVWGIFPYDIDQNGVVHPIRFGDFRQRFPHAASYLTRHRDEIFNNVKQASRNPELWHLYTRENNHDKLFPKVFVPMTSQDTYATYTEQRGIYSDNANVFFLNVCDNTPEKLHALAAIINSTLFSVIGRMVANPQAAGNFKFNKQFLKLIPFPTDNFNNNLNGLVTKLSELAQEIFNEQERYLRSTPAQKRTRRAVLIRRWDRLDGLVYDLYELEDPIREIFQTKGRNVNRIDILDQMNEQ